MKWSNIDLFHSSGGVGSSKIVVINERVGMNIAWIKVNVLVLIIHLNAV